MQSSLPNPKRKISNHFSITIVIFYCFSLFIDDIISFFSPYWTGLTKALWNNIDRDIHFHTDIPEITLTVPKFEFSDDVKLEANVDVDVTFFIWLKKNDGKDRFEILPKFGESTSGQMRSDSYELKKFSKDDEGQYQLIVASKETVGRKIFQLHAGKRYHFFRLPFWYIECKMTCRYINQG